MIEAKIRGLGRFYKDGTERIEIWVKKREAQPLPYEEGERVPVKLVIGHKQYEAGLRSTKDFDTVWFSPNVLDQNQNKDKLAYICKREGLLKNQTVNLHVDGKRITLLEEK